MVPLSLTVVNVYELDDGGRAGHRHLPAAAGDRFPVRSANLGKWDLPVPDSIRKTLFAKIVTLFSKTVNLFLKRLQLNPLDLLLNLHCTMTLSAANSIHS